MNSTTNPDENQTEEEKTEPVEYKFHPDIAIKKFLRGISSPRLIGIINAILTTNYPTSSQVTFGTTEFFTITGDLEKDSRRCDLLVDMKDVRESEVIHNKTLIELQSTSDKTMGFRMFIYALNVSEEDKENQTYKLPSAFTLYTTLDVPEKGVDKAHIVSSEGKKLFTFEVPYYNVLATEYDQFGDSPLELLKILYLYRYRKNPKLLKKSKELKKILDNLQDYALNEDDPDRAVICELLADMLHDVATICRREKYWKELDMMETMNQTYSQMMVEKGRLEGEQKGRLEGEQKGRLEGEQKGELKGKLEGELKKSIEIAKNLIGKMANIEIATVTGLPLSQIEQLRANS